MFSLALSTLQCLKDSSGQFQILSNKTSISRRGEREGERERGWGTKNVYTVNFTSYKKIGLEKSNQVLKTIKQLKY